MSDLAKRVKKIRTTLGLTQTEFGERFGKTLSAIQKYEAGTRQLDQSTAMLIHYVFGVNLDWLSTGVGGMFLKNDVKEGEILLPIFDAYASAGYGAWLNGEAIIGYYKMPGDMVKKDWKAVPNDTIMLYVKGDSMAPLLQNNDIVAVDKSKRDMVKGLYVCRLCNDLYIKNVTFHQDNVILLSENPEYEPIIAKYDDFELIGKVIWFGRALNR